MCLIYTNFVPLLYNKHYSLLTKYALARLGTVPVNAERVCSEISRYT